MEQLRSRGKVETTSRVDASPEAIWARATSPEGINSELGPWMKMTVPRGLESGLSGDLEVPVRLGRSWILAFGLLPIDYDDIFVAELEPDRRFRERSTMLSMSLWEHERTLERRDASTAVTDRIGFELRRPLRWLPGAYAIAGAVVSALFRHRHRRLARHFGGAGARSG